MNSHTVVNYFDPKAKEHSLDPAEYIGVVVPPFRAGALQIEGRFNLVSFLSTGLDTFKILTITSAYLEALISMLAISGNKFLDNDYEIHLIECYKTVSELFNIPEDQMPTAEALHVYVTEKVMEYTAEKYDEIEFKIHCTDTSSPDIKEKKSDAPIINERDKTAFATLKMSKCTLFVTIRNGKVVGLDEVKLPLPNQKPDLLAGLLEEPPYVRFVGN